MIYAETMSKIVSRIIPSSCRILSTICIRRIDLKRKTYITKPISLQSIDLRLNANFINDSFLYQLKNIIIQIQKNKKNKWYLGKLLYDKLIVCRIFEISE